MKYIDIILVNVELLLSLIDDILDNSKIERNMLNLSFNEFNIKQLFSEIWEIFEIQANGKGISLSFKMMNFKNEEVDDIEIKSDWKWIK